MKAATRHNVLYAASPTISIHAAREGGDHCGFFFLIRQPISIHAAREGGDDKFGVCFFVRFVFQSTPPVKAATTTSVTVLRSVLFQSTPPVKAATSSLMTASSAARISIHAAREGGDDVTLADYKAALRISIHAAREGGDHIHRDVSVSVAVFQSTPPVKAATAGISFRHMTARFQSTPPVKAATTVPSVCVAILSHFNPRRP